MLEAIMTSFRWLLLFVLLALPAHAADVVYPTGSRVGLAPPPGMAASKSFLGFEDRDNRVALVIVPLPAEAFADITKSSTSEILLKQGIKLETREDVSHPLGKAFLAIGRQEIEKTPLR